MAQISVNFKRSMGKMKPMHATNNGPSVSPRDGGDVTADWRIGANMAEFRAAGIPYARNHDASFFARYGLEHTVDVVAIFPDFDADVNDPASYDFTCTDNYLQAIEMAGTKTFYRLGHRIEHEVKKYGTLPPKDFQKWAEICEHIIRHYTEGWADGFHMDIEYWEIWNEPDLDPDDAQNKRTWGGTKAEFFEFYHIAATHLKSCFPHLKIGGPALANKLDWAEEFLAQLKAPLDFFSWHIYACHVEKMVAKVQAVRALLDKYGFTETESILNEWNYVRGWHGEEMIYSNIQRKALKGASFVAAAMCDCQRTPLDMLMYYDARPSGWCGMFDFAHLGKCTLKPYFPFYMFNVLYGLGTEAESVSDDGDVHVCAAVGEAEAALMLNYYNDDDTADEKQVSVGLAGFGGDAGTEAEVYLLDDEHDLTLAYKLIFFGERFVWETTVPKHTCYLVKLKKRV